MSIILNSSFWRRNIFLLLFPKTFFEGWQFTFIGYSIWNNGIMMEGVVFNANGFIFNFKLYLLSFRFRASFSIRIFCIVSFISTFRFAFLIGACYLGGINRLLPSFSIIWFLFLLRSLRKKCPYLELFWSVFSSDVGKYGTE